jgi:hypothetical protein
MTVVNSNVAIFRVMKKNDAMLKKTFIDKGFNTLKSLFAIDIRQNRQKLFNTQIFKQLQSH